VPAVVIEDGMSVEGGGATVCLFKMFGATETTLMGKCEFETNQNTMYSTQSKAKTVAMTRAFSGNLINFTHAKAFMLNAILVTLGLNLCIAFCLV
jgi:hypothetical protein